MTVSVEPGTVVRVSDLSKSFDDREVLSDLDLRITTGEFVVLLGRSGCGKSTLLRILAGLDTDITGDAAVPQHRSVGFQQPRLMPWKRVWRNVVLGLPGRPDRALADTALAEVGLTDLAGAWPKTLSGGQAQRVSLARALVRKPDLLLLDEPFGALDALTRVAAQKLVEDLWRSHGCAVLMVTHDVEEALLLADRVLVMEDGRIAHQVRLPAERPRDITSADFVATRRDILDRLGVR
ncbi:ABC transporter ATP-binding protein [Tsukamurella sp. NPDC003166]|uniref:ABC transporter ATP-binding protein n=1 Tax=Tsukamurella sp. NPDC003166 TaxID=3154444 RepID=UPI0033A36B92